MKENLEQLLRNTNQYVKLWYVANVSFIILIVMFTLSFIMESLNTNSTFLIIATTMMFTSMLSACSLIYYSLKIRKLFNKYASSSKEFKNITFKDMKFSMYNKEHRALYKTVDESLFKTKLKNLKKKKTY